MDSRRLLSMLKVFKLVKIMLAANIEFQHFVEWTLLSKLFQAASWSRFHFFANSVPLRFK